MPATQATRPQVKLEVIQFRLVDAALREYGVRPAGNVEARVLALRECFLGQGAAATLARCDTCDEVSDAVLAACPFCGDTEMEADEPAKAAEPRDLAPCPELDAAVAGLRRWAAKAAVDLYKAGEALREVRKARLWQRRVTADGDQAYAGFYQWCEAEAGIKHAFASRLIRVSEQFTQEDMERFGVTRLDVSLRLPVEERRRFLAQAERLPARGPELRAAAAAFAPGEAAAPPAAVQAEVPLGTWHVPLYRRNRAGGSNPDGREQGIDVVLGPARHLKEDPWLRFKLAEGPRPLTLFVRLRTEGNGDLGAIVQIQAGA